MPSSPATNSPEEFDIEGPPSGPSPPGGEVLALEVPSHDDTSSSETDEVALDPKEEKALALLGKVFARRTQNEADEETRLLEDETFMIREAAKRLTGVSLLANSSDKRLLVAHHLQDFFAALPLPPDLDSATRQSLRREALTMLLKLSPQDDIERMLLVQLIASHMTSMACFARMAAPDTSQERAAQAVGQAQKMSRLFLDIESAFRRRRKDLGVPASANQKVDPKRFADMILSLLRSEGITFDDVDASP